MTVPAAQADRRHSPWLVLSVLCLGFFMILLDTTIVNIAIPSISDKLHASLWDIVWILNSSIVVYALLLIRAGRLGDIYARKQRFQVGLGIFTLDSVRHGLAERPT